jgi:hypothetical protein
MRRARKELSAAAAWHAERKELHQNPFRRTSHKSLFSIRSLRAPFAQNTAAPHSSLFCSFLYINISQLASFHALYVRRVCGARSLALVNLLKASVQSSLQQNQHLGASGNQNARVDSARQRKCFAAFKV